MSIQAEYDRLRCDFGAMLDDIADYKSEQAILALLMSNGDHIAFHTEQLKKWGIFFKEEPYIIASLTSGPDFSPPARSNLSTYKLVSDHYSGLRRLIHSFMDEEFDVCTVNMPGRIFCIMNFSGKNPEIPEAERKHIGDIFRALNDLIDDELINADISRVQYGVRGLPQAFNDSLFVSKYRSILGSFSPHNLYYDDISFIPEEDEDTLIANNRIFQQFNQHIAMGRLNCAESSLITYLNDYVKRQNGKISFALESQFHLIKLQIIKAFSEYADCGNAECLRTEENHMFIRKALEPALDFDGLISAVSAVCAELTRVCSGCGEKEALANKIRLYVNDNYTDPELNINKIADYFSKSPSYLGKVFKAKYSSGIVEYIQAKRVEAVNSMLGRDKTIKEIAVQTGFGNSQNLIRIYKKLEGVTPGENNVKQGEARAV